MHRTEITIILLFFTILLILSNLAFGLKLLLAKKKFWLCFETIAEVCWLETWEILIMLYWSKCT